MHLAAVYRWVRHGVRGVMLESLRVGGTTYTSLEALQRFAEALGSSAPHSNSQTPRQRRQSLDRVATKVAAELGISDSSIVDPAKGVR